MGKRGKRLLITPAGAIALLLAFAAAAWACTVFRGTLTVQGNAASGEVTTEGLRVGMTETVSSGVAKATSNDGFFRMKTGVGDNNNKLPATDPNGTLKKYYVKFYNSGVSDANGDGVKDPGYSDHTNWFTDCMAGSPPIAFGTLLGSVTLDTGGRITTVQYAGSPLILPVVPGSYVKFDLADGLNKDVAPAESAVCISDPGAAYGNQAPLAIV